MAVPVQRLIVRFGDGDFLGHVEAYKDADSRAYALTETLKPLRDLDWKTLMALGGKGADPKAMIAIAFQEMAENAQKIGELNVSPDLLKSLIGTAGE